MQMPLSKSRGKSAAIAMASDYSNGSNLSNSSSQQASLLKIESVLPTLSRNPNKSIFRSYSTLSSGYLKKTPDARSELDRKLQNSQNSQNGFWRIQRSAKEKEKLPDRINLDRRGLTALPIIDDEPNLRLLSLQHNLINAFCVPECQPRPTDKTEEKKCSVPTNTADVYAIKKPSPKVPKSQQLLMQKTSTRNLLMNGNNVNIPNKFSNVAAVPCNVLNGTSAATTIPNNSNGLISHNSNNNNNAIMKNSFIQKSVLLHSKGKYAFKKSSSFINSYSQHLAASKMNLGRLMENKLSPNMTSFSIDATMSSDAKCNKSSSSATPSPLPVTTNQSPIDPFLSIANNLQNLVFIDLYDNQIEKISPLDGLKSLTVLLLGKNRITDIAGIVSVKHTLRVLDLHGNKITSITHKISQLQELKSLNLAGNCLKQVHVDDFKGLCNLRELNLKRNKIKKIAGFEDLRNLERLWLCHNDLQKVEDMSSIAKAINLKEVTIENNPVSLGGDCVSFVVSYLPCLILLSQMQVTEQVRRAAMAWRKSKETSDANYSLLSNDVGHSMRREEIISNARTNWELLRSQQHVNKSSSYIQKTIKNTSQQLQVPVSEIEVDVYSDLSDSVRAIDRRTVQQRHKAVVTARHRNGGKKHPPVASKRSSSQDNLVHVAENGPTKTTDEFFRLPPILAPFLDENFLSTVTTGSTPNSSSSSVGPNMDSSSSCSSYGNGATTKPNAIVDHNLKDKDDEAIAQLINVIQEEIIIEKNEQRATSKQNSTESQNSCMLEPIAETSKTSSPTKSNSIIFTPPPPPSPPLQPMPNPSDEANANTSNITEPDDTQSDKNSNLSSSTSNKTTNDSIASEETKSSQKCKSATPNRKYNSPLIRAHTAKSININGPMPIQPHQYHQKTSKPSATTVASGNTTVTSATTNDREREQGGDYLIEICGRYLNVYGAGAIKFIDRQWNSQKANDVHTFKFSYVNFNSIATILGKVKMRFPNAENFVFRETNINSLGQLNALAEVQGISSLIIDPEGNQVCTKNWRMYAVYRLSHWGIKSINGMDVDDDEIQEAQRTYAGLSDLVLWSLPDALLEPLLTRLRLEETCTASKMLAKQWLMQADASLKNVVGKEALLCKRGAVAAASGSGVSGIGPDETVLRQRGRTYFTFMMENTCNAVEKLQRLETLWPNLLVEMIRNTLLDYAQIDVYVKNLLTEMIRAPH